MRPVSAAVSVASPVVPRRDESGAEQHTTSPHFTYPFIRSFVRFLESSLFLVDQNYFANSCVRLIRSWCARPRVALTRCDTFGRLVRRMRVSEQPGVLVRCTRSAPGTQSDHPPHTRCCSTVVIVHLSSICFCTPLYNLSFSLSLTLSCSLFEFKHKTKQKANLILYIQPNRFVLLHQNYCSPIAETPS